MLYIAPVIIDLDKLNGVSKKILNHYKIFSTFYDADMLSYGPDCLYYFHDDRIEIIPVDKLNRRLKLYLFIKHSLLPNEYKYIYIRYHLSDFLFIYILKLLNKNNSKIVIEIPTFPYKHELLKWKKGVVRYFIDRTSHVFLKLYVGRILTYSDDTNIFGIKTIKTINGIIYDAVDQVKKQVHPKSEINLISVSHTMSCHGYDRLIEGLNNFYTKEGNINILYHLVGEGEEIKKYEGLVKQYGLQNHVKFYGFISGNELDEIYDKADIAINSLGIHRIGLKTESTIKSKEYAAKGLPIISSYEIDAFSSEENDKFVFRVPADESAVDVESLIEFYKQIYLADNADVSDEIRKASQKRCDMIITLQGVIEYFNSNIELEK